MLLKNSNDLSAANHFVRMILAVDCLLNFATVTSYKFIELCILNESDGDVDGSLKRLNQSHIH